MIWYDENLTINIPNVKLMMDLNAQLSNTRCILISSGLVGGSGKPTCGRVGEKLGIKERIIIYYCLILA